MASDAGRRIDCHGQSMACTPICWAQKCNGSCVGGLAVLSMEDIAARNRG